MMRAVGLVLALGLGLAAALVTQTRLYHLRYVLPDRLPAWTAALSGEAGLFDGRMRPGLAAAPNAVLRWRAAAPGAGGWRWRLALVGGGLDLTADLELAFGATRAVIGGLRGTVDIGALSGPGVDAEGVVQIAGGAVTIARLRTAPRAQGGFEARILRAALDGAALGGGPLTARLDPLQSWQVAFGLVGGVADVDGVLSGRLPRRSAGATLTIAATDAIPESWRNALALIGEATDDGWVLRQKLPLDAFF